MSIEAMEQALEALIQIRTPLRVNTSLDAYYVSRAITSLRQAIAEAEKQEPVAVIGSDFQLLWCRQDWSKGLKVGDCLYTHPQPKREPLTDERLELIGHADLAINNIYIFNGYGEDVPEGRTPIYAGYKAAHGIKGEA